MNQPASPQAPPAPEAPGEMSRKEKFFRFTERFGHMMSRVLLTVLYVTLVAPAGILLSLFSDKLGIRRFRGTSWNDWKRTNETPSQARRQD